MAKLSEIYSKGELAPVASTGQYGDLVGKPALGSAAPTAITDYATAAQGELAASALQPTLLTTNGDLITRIAGVVARLGIGTEGQILKAIGGVLAWGDAPAGGISNPIGTVFQSTQTVTYNQGATSTLNNETHNTFTLTANGTGTTIAHSNVPGSGNRYGFELHLNWTTGTITWPASWTKGDGKPTVIGNYVITGVTIDGGTSWKIAVLKE